MSETQQWRRTLILADHRSSLQRTRVERGRSGLPRSGELQLLGVSVIGISDHSNLFRIWIWCFGFPWRALHFVAFRARVARSSLLLSFAVLEIRICFGFRISCFGFLSSSLLPARRLFRLWLLTSDLRPPTSDLRLPTSAFWPPTSGLWTLSGSRLWTLDPRPFSAPRL